MFNNQKTKNGFLFLKIKKLIFSNDILVIFICFLMIVLKNNYTNIKKIIKNKSQPIKIIFKTY